MIKLLKILDKHYYSSLPQMIIFPGDLTEEDKPIIPKMAAHEPVATRYNKFELHPRLHKHSS